MKGSVYKRCQCPVEHNAKGERLACKKAHGSWSFVADAGLNPATGGRRQLKRGGFETKKEAEAALAAAIDSAAKGTMVHDERQTLGAYLDGWLADKIAKGLRPTTARSYRYHVEKVIRPIAGHVRLRDVRPDHVDQVLRSVTAGPATVRRVHATMRSALASAVRRRLIPWNPAADLDLPSAPRPKVRPWEPDELGKFLDHVASDPLSALFETIAATGMRRGEVLGLQWADVDLDRGRLVVRRQVFQLDGAEHPCDLCGGTHRGLAFGRPKTASGEDRTVDLDGGVVGVLIAHRLAQDTERAAWGDAYVNHGLVFAREDGTPLRPEAITKRFAQLVKTAKLPPVRLHDLRHGQASLMLAAGVPIAVVSKRLGHSTIALTSDTYSHLLEGVGRDAAERAAALVPRASRDQSVTNEAPETIEAPGVNAGGPVFAGGGGAPRGT